MNQRLVGIGLLMAVLCFSFTACGPADEGEATIVDLGDVKADGEIPTLVTKITTKFAFNAGVEKLELSRCDKSTAGCNMSPDFVNAYWLLYLDELSYKPRKDIEAGIKKIGLKPTEFAFFNNELAGTQAYYLEVGNVAILTFRGTQADQIVDFTTDANTLIVDGFHEGFLSQFQAIWEDRYVQTDTVRTDLGGYLATRFPKGNKKLLYINGHSLGGALANIALGKCINAGYPVQALYVFGCPRTMTSELAIDLFQGALARNIPVYRWVHGGDIVPTIPLPVPFIREYQHIGEEEWQTLYHVSATKPVVLTIGEQASPGGISVAEHYPDKYKKDMKSYINSSKGQKALLNRRCSRGLATCPK